MYSSASRTFDEARNLVNQVKQARGSVLCLVTEHRQLVAAGPVVEAGREAGPPAPALPEKELLASLLAPHSSPQRSFGKVGSPARPCAEDRHMAPVPVHTSCATVPATLLEIVQTVAQEESQDRTSEQLEQAD